MKSGNDFISKFSLIPKYDSLEALIDEYNEINENIESLKLKKKHYDDLINSDEKNDSSGLTLKEKYFIYTLIKKEFSKNSIQMQFDIDLYSLKSKFENLYNDLYEYLSITEKINSLYEKRRDIVSDFITFNFIDVEHFSEHCLERHTFVKEENELKCVYCGATTKDYSLSKKEFDFLVMCAKEQNMLLEDFTKEDWPLLQIIIEQQNDRRSLIEEIDESSEHHLDRIEQQFYNREHEYSELKMILKTAHELDNQAYEDRNEKKCLPDIKKKKLLENLEKELDEIENSDSRFKSLLIEQCRTAKYEILILSGENIPSLLKKTTTEDEKIALTKAYYNLSNTQFRQNSNYFDSINSSILYDCYTANPEINNKILEMKLRK